jgi:neutral amino acid transport system permease protein
VTPADARRPVLALVLLLLLVGSFAAPALAQDPADPVDPEEVEAVDEDDAEEVDEEEADALLAEDAADDEEESPEGFRGTLSYRGEDGQELVGGVLITLADADGNQIDEAETADDGTFRLSAPGPGAYVVTIEPETLPDGIFMRNPDRIQLDLRLAPRQVATVAFPIQEGEGGRGATDTTTARAARLFASGLRFGLTIALCAVGLSLIFGTTGLVNFAHGELVTFGALIAYMFNRTFGLHLFVAVPLALIVAALAGGLLDRGFWRPLRNRGTGLIAMLVISIGLGLLLRYVFIYQFGDRRQTFAQYAIQTRGMTIGPVTLVPREIASILISAVVLVIVALVLQKTKIGKAMRAVSDNRDLAESSGIDVQRVITVVWMAGATLAALGGVLLGLAEQISWNMGFNLLLLMFAAVILGGLGTAYGALVGGIAIGIFVQMSTMVVPTELKNVAALFVLILILLVRPQGILGQAERIG